MLTLQQLDALHWVLIEACDLHNARDLASADKAIERNDLESLIDILVANGRDVTEIRDYLGPEV